MRCAKLRLGRRFTAYRPRFVSAPPETPVQMRALILVLGETEG